MALTAASGNAPVDKPTVAWDGENIAFGGQDYVPAVTARGFYVGTTGDVQVVTPAGNTVTYHGVPAGAVVPQAFVKMVNAGTTASNLVAMA